MFRSTVLIAFLLVLSASTWLPAAEGRIPLSEPYAVLGAITQSGSYIVTNDLDAPSGPGIIIEADHVTIDLDGHTVRVSDASPAIYAYGYTDITVLNGKLFGDGIGLDGISFFGAGAEFRVENVTITGFSGAGIYVVGTVNAARAVLVGNTVRGGGGAGFAGVYLSNVEASRIEQNQLRESIIGMSLEYVVDSIVKDNVLSQNVSYGLELRAADNNTISENTVTRNTSDGINICCGSAEFLPPTSINNIITHNDVSQNGGNGIYIVNYAGFYTVSYNNMSRNSGHGINMEGNFQVDGGSSITFSYNNASGNGLNGIRLKGKASFNTISYNSASGNGSNGIFLDDAGNALSPVDNTLDWNVAAGNGDCGIRFGTGATFVTGNIFSNNRAPGNLNSSTTCGSPGLPAGYFDGACVPGPSCNVDAGGNQ